MASKKNISKPAPKKSVVKSTAKPAKPASASKKPVKAAAPAKVKKKPVKEAASPKVKKSPVKAAASAKVKKSPVKAAASAKVKKKPVKAAASAKVKKSPVKAAASAKVKKSPVKAAAPAKVKKAPVKAAAPAKVKKTPVNAAVPVKVKKAPATAAKADKSVVKKVSTPAKKIAAPAAEKAVKPVVNPEVSTAEIKPAAQPKASVPLKKAPAAKPRSSVVDFPAPPAPIKPPFVPPKAAPPLSGETVAPGSNGTHSPAFVQKQRQRLLDLRDDLMDAVSGMARDTIRNAPEGSEASGSGQHQGDAGSDAYDRDFALSVLAKEQDALYEIEQALRRIQSGSYGICEMSSRKIPQARLEAIPFARLTVECQAQWEKEYGNRRFRPSNEVGFSGGKYAEDEDSETVSLDEDDD